jgi:hypothetical protein
MSEAVSTRIMKNCEKGIEEARDWGAGRIIWGGKKKPLPLGSGRGNDSPEGAKVRP